MTEEAVEPQSDIETMIDQAQPEQEMPEKDHEEEAYNKTMIPLSVAQKLRIKNKELEMENQWMKQQQQAAVKQPEQDDSRFESATREDLNKSQAQIIRDVEERMWIKQNPEKYEMVNTQLPQFLKQRPNLASAINMSSNRYEEAFELMDKLTPKQQTQLKKDIAPSVKKQAPNAPSGVPKSAAMSDAVDVMSMNDTEFAAWRASKKGSRLSRG